MRVGACVGLWEFVRYLIRFFAQHAFHPRRREPNLFSADRSQLPQSCRPFIPNLLISA